MVDISVLGGREEKKAYTFLIAESFLQLTYITPPWASNPFSVKNKCNN